MSCEDTLTRSISLNYICRNDENRCLHRCNHHPCYHCGHYHHHHHNHISQCYQYPCHQSHLHHHNRQPQFKPKATNAKPSSLSSDTSAATSVEIPHKAGSSAEARRTIRPLPLDSAASSENNASRSITWRCMVNELLHTVGELEHSLFENQQQDFELRMALERQREKVNDLILSLDNEKRRNQRLMQLVRGIDACASSTDEDDENLMLYNYGGSGIDMVGSVGWQTKSNQKDIIKSISPLLMQQRYEELSRSHKQCRRQLVKKDKQLTTTKCENEELQAKYDNLLDEYRIIQHRCEEICRRYLRIQSKKNHEIIQLRDALNLASDCVQTAQQFIEHINISSHEKQANRRNNTEHNGRNFNKKYKNTNKISTFNGKLQKYVKDFRQNLQLFLKATGDRMNYHI